MKFIPLILLLILFSCANKPQERDLKNVKPGKLEFFETYSFSEITPSWQAACKWIKSHDSLALQGKVSLLKMDKRGLEALVLRHSSNMIGYVKDTDMQQVNEMLALPEVKKHFFKDIRFLWSHSAEEEENGHRLYALYAVKKPTGNKTTVSGKNIVSADVVESYTGKSAISITMDDQGAHDWEIMTTKNVGRAIAIALNDQVLFCPIVYNTIEGGATEISGNFTKAEAQELADQIYAGRMIRPKH